MHTHFPASHRSALSLSLSLSIHIYVSRVLEDTLTTASLRVRLEDALTSMHTLQDALTGMHMRLQDALTSMHIYAYILTGMY